MRVAHLLFWICASAQFSEELHTRTFLNGSFYSLAFPFAISLKQYIFEEQGFWDVEPFVQIAGQQPESKHYNQMEADLEKDPDFDQSKSLEISRSKSSDSEFPNWIPPGSDIQESQYAVFPDSEHTHTQELDKVAGKKAETPELEPQGAKVQSSISDLKLDQISVIRGPELFTLSSEPQSLHHEVAVTCSTESLLELRLQDGCIANSEGRKATVDADHLFQFDTQQNMKACGWSVSEYGELSLHGSTLFYQCHSGNAYKIYDAPISSRCLPVVMEVVEVVFCEGTGGRGA